MIDHVSIGVKNLSEATRFYETILAVIGSRKLVERPGTVGFGKKYPEFWLNARPALRSGESAPDGDGDGGCHVCLRAASVQAVDELYIQAIALGATSSGEPGFRPEYHESYYACFIKDADNNHFEVVTFDPG